MVSTRRTGPSGWRTQGPSPVAPALERLARVGAPAACSTVLVATRSAKLSVPAKPVATRPGQQQLAVTPVPPRRRASSIVNSTSSSFDFPYAAKAPPRPNAEVSVRIVSGLTVQPMRCASDAVTTTRAGADATRRSRSSAGQQPRCEVVDGDQLWQPFARGPLLGQLDPRIVHEHVDTLVAVQDLACEIAYVAHERADPR